MQNRREFLGALAAPAAAVAATGVLLPSRARAAVAELAGVEGSPEELAEDEAYWAVVQRAFTVDRSLVNLNNGGVSPSPAFVQEAMKSHLDFSNEMPVHNMWCILEPRREFVRERLAKAWGVDTEEVAVTRNASEGLQTCQFGFDLEPGDEVLTTTQDYHRMLTTFRQRERRDGIVLRRFSLPIPCEDPARVVELFREHISDRTRLILMCHMVNLTGQILPVREVVAMARERGIPVIVDGAHALAHFEFRLDELECDYYASSLHKWLFAPHGTGLLYVRRDKIADLWPLMGAREEQTDDIRKFEEIGTHPAANFLAIGEALTFHEGIGAARKQARLVHLRERWVRRLLASDRVRLNTSLAPGHACGIANVTVEGLDTQALRDHLWDAHGIFTAAINHEEFQGLRVSPSVYTTHEELDRFCDAVERAMRDGLPA